MKKLLIISILFVAVMSYAVFVLAQDKKSEIAHSSNQSKATESEIIFFYGDGCPHCAIVEKYFEENNVQDKISFTQKEVYHNQNNAKELQTKAKICGIPTNSIGVPFLWDGKKCLIGDKDIVDFFKQKMDR